MNSSNNQEIHPHQRNWNNWLRSARWRDNLARRATHKALDIPEDDVQISTDNSKRGLGWKELLVILAAMTGIGIGSPYIYNQIVNNDDPVEVPAGTTPNDSEYEVRFYNSKGELIEVPRVNQ